jgi:acid-sensing ion channel, other
MSNQIINSYTSSIGGVTAAAQACDPEVFGDVDPQNKTNCEQCSDYLKHFMGNLDSLFNYCSHVRFEAKCSDMFKQVITEEGVCFNYNGLDIYRDINATNNDQFENWSLEDGYKNNVEHLNVRPHPGSKIYLTMGLGLYKWMNDILCKGVVEGFKVYLHLPNEAPQISKHFYLAAYHSHTQILISPRMITTDPELRNFPVDKRQCYFNDERYLRFFKYYTQNNCEIECVANMTLKKCGCVVFYMPSKISRDF